jgi:phage-related protein
MFYLALTGTLAATSCQVASELEALQADQAKLSVLKQEATVLARVHAEAEALKRDIDNLDASSGGATTKSPEDLELEIAEVERDL